MKLAILCLVLLGASCASTPATASREAPAISDSATAPATPSVAVVADPPTSRLPRRLHTDRFDAATKAWIRDRR